VTALVSSTQVIKTLKDKIKVLYPDMKFVFDPSLTYDSGTKLLRSQQNMIQLNENETPLLMFNRSSLYYSAVLGRRMVRDSLLKNMTLATALQYKEFYGSFDFEFAIASPNLYVIDEHELEYLTKIGMPSITEIDVAVPQLGLFPYELTWKDLEKDVLFEYATSFIKVIKGSCTITGWFLVIKGEAKLIHSIYGKFFDMQNQLMEAFVVS
jgi:hypothetical protein